MTKKNKFDKNEKGFTLIELIVVMIIIGILVLLATPRFLNYIEKARYTRIINDIRVVETVSLPEMARNDMKFPLGTANEETDLTTEANELRAYKKDGLIVKGTSNGNFVPTVAGISDTKLDEISSGYYQLSKSDFVKPEIKTRLDGEFYINRDGEVVYVDSNASSGEKEESKDSTGLFLYMSDDPSSRDSGIITGLNVNHEYWEKEENKITDYEIEGKLFDGHKIPSIPDVRVMDDGSKTPIVEIGRSAFSRYHDDLGILVGKDFRAGNNLEKVGKHAFHRNMFIGQNVYHVPAFYDGEFKGGENLKKIDDYAFSGNEFIGNFDSRNIDYIGERAFSSNNFGSKFIPRNKLTHVGVYAFSENKFTGDFDSNKIEHIDKGAFNRNLFNGRFIAQDPLVKVNRYAFAGDYFTPEQNNFIGTFDANNIEYIGYDAFGNSTFTGQFDSKKIEIIESSAFHKSKFSGEILIREALKEIASDDDGRSSSSGSTYGSNTFRDSRFTGELDLKNVTIIGGWAFESSNFTGDLKSEKLEYLRGGAFRQSEFGGEINLPNLKEFGLDRGTHGFTGPDFTNASFTKINPPELRNAIENNEYWKKAE